VVPTSQQPDIRQPVTVIKKEMADTKAEQLVKHIAKKKKRSVSLESFSRAPLREKKEVVIPDAKELNDKEQ
jgi:hypothetical protein